MRGLHKKSLNIRHVMYVSHSSHCWPTILFFCVWLGLRIINRYLQVITSRNCSYQICWPAALAVPHMHIVCVAFCIKWTHIWICKTYKKYQHHTALPNPLAELLNINFSDKCNEIGVFHWSMYAHKWMHFIQQNNRQATRTIKEEVVKGLLLLA